MASTGHANRDVTSLDSWPARPRSQKASTMNLSRTVVLLAAPVLAISTAAGAYATHPAVSSHDGSARPSVSPAPKLPAPSPGAVALGQLAELGSLCTGGTAWTQSQLDPANPTYTVPFAGVITSWSTNANAVAGNAALLTFTPGA